MHVIKEKLQPPQLFTPARQPERSTDAFVTLEAALSLFPLPVVTPAHNACTSCYNRAIRPRRGLRRKHAPGGSASSHGTWLMLLLL